MAPQFSMVHTALASAASAFLLTRITPLSFTTAFVATFSLGLLVYVSFWSYVYPIHLSPLRHVPTVPGFPLWGQFMTIITSEVGVPQRTWHQQYGGIIRYFFPFGSERISVVDDEALRHMTVRNPYNYPKPLRARLWMERILGREGVLLSEGDQHVRQRKTLTPGFSIQAIRDLNPVFWRKALLMADLWKREFVLDTVKTKTFEVLEWLNRATLDIIGEAGFGTVIDSLEYPTTALREAYRLMFAFDFVSHALLGIQAFIPATHHIPAKMTRDMARSRKMITETANTIIESKYKDSDSKSRDIMALIVRDNEKAKAHGEELTHEMMRDQIMTFLGAGHDTTATGIAWTLHMLSKHPEIQRRVRDEVKKYIPGLFDSGTRALGAEEFAKFDVDQLPYLNNVCRESLRYIPPIPMTVRQSIRDDTLCGYLIPAGTTVYVLANTINRLPQYWGSDADVFDPERWNHLPESFTANAYMTFLQGPRGCIGRKFAETEMKIILCCLLSDFQFSARGDIEDAEALKMWRLVLRPRDGVSLKASLLT